MLLPLNAERGNNMKDIKVISHRGANRYAPQNTIAAFKKAVELKADGFETDVHLTKDGELVICHNYTIDETSNGKGNIADKTLAELQGYDFGGYFSPKFANEKIPTVKEFLEVVKESEIECLNIEIKSPLNNETYIVDETIKLVKESGLFDRLIISSFDPKILTRAKEIDELCKTGYLYSVNKKITYQNKMITNYVQYAKSIGADALHPQFLFVNERYVERAHDAGIMVHPWTVNSVSSIERMIKCGCDKIITDFPDVTRGLIEKHTY